jgi:hypothetical protein
VAITEVANSLWTPEGEKVLREKDVVIVQNPLVRETFIRMHEVAFHEEISMVCKRCDSAITGKNNDDTRVLAVACKCREWRFVR